jgi:YHS domain-containing protein
MKTTILTIVAAAALVVGAGRALAQHEHPDAPAGQPKQPDQQPADKGKHAHDEKASARVGDPYPLDACPISGKKLGAMGDPVVKLYAGREVRFCCDSCPAKFEKDLDASLAKLDEKIIKDQAPLYPLKTSVVTGKDLPEKPFEFVYGNRLIRVGAQSEKADFLKDPKRYVKDLDKAVVAAQGKDYPLKACPVSHDELAGEKDENVDVVLAGRLVRLCCKDCKNDIEKEPAKFIAAIDQARKGDTAKPADEKEGGHKKGGG